MHANLTSIARLFSVRKHLREGHHMPESDIAKGKLDQAKGKAKEAVGEATDDTSKEAEGKFDQAKGKAQEEFGKAKDKLDDDE